MSLQCFSTYALWLKLIFLKFHKLKRIVTKLLVSEEITSVLCTQVFIGSPQKISSVMCCSFKDTTTNTTAKFTGQKWKHIRGGRSDNHLEHPVCIEFKYLPAPQLSERAILEVVFIFFWILFSHTNSDWFTTSNSIYFLFLC